MVSNLSLQEPHHSLRNTQLASQVTNPWRASQREKEGQRLWQHQESLVHDHPASGRRVTVHHPGPLRIIQAKAGRFCPSKPLTGSSRKQGARYLFWVTTTATMATSLTSCLFHILSIGCPRSPLRRSLSMIVRTALRRRKRGSR